MRFPLLILAALCLVFTTARAQTPPPNVLLIIADDMAWTDYGFMNHPHIKTPNLDKLAAQSAVFTSAYTPTSLCRASLASIITGQYPHQHKITCNDPPEGTPRAAMLDFIKQAPSLPRLLKERGYRSLQTGKWWEGHYTNGGFTDGMTTKGRHGEEGLAIGRQTLKPIHDFVAASDKQAPWFIWYAPMMPHMPHNPPQRTLQNYIDKGFDERVAKYYAMCEWFDDTVGQLLTHLDQQNLSENTLILFTADNGWLQPTIKDPLNGARGLPKGKNSPYDAGLRTPILLHWPQRIQPARHQHLASTIDLAPTILQAAGLQPHPDMPGLPLLDLATGKSNTLPRETLYGQMFVHTAKDLQDPKANLTHRWLRHQDWKLIEPTDPKEPAELYNLQTDPHEKANLASEDPDQLKTLRAKLQAWYPLGGTGQP